MNGLLGRLNALIRAMSIPARAIVLVGISTLACLIAVACVYDPADLTPVWAIVTAWMACTGSALGALVLSLAWHGTPNGVVGALAGMMVGLGIPLALAIFVQRKIEAFAQAGFYGWIVVFYLVSLTVKTLLVAPGYAPADPYGPHDDLNSPAKKSGA